MRSLMAAVALGLGALASVAPAQVPQPQRLPPTVTTDPSSTVTVQNQRSVPVTVYLESGRFDRRLGVVGPFDVATLRLPTWAVRGRERVQLFAHPEGSPYDLSTDVLSLRDPSRLAMVVHEGPHPPAPPPDTMSAVIPPEQLEEATLTVDNGRDRTVTVYARQDRFDVRLGQVQPRSRATLRFPKSVVHPAGSIELVVHPEGGADLASERMRVERGKHVGLRVPPG